MLRRCLAKEPPTRDSCPPVQARIDSEALAMLQAQPWPGNLRQLDNVIRRAYAYSLIDAHENTSQRVVETSHVEKAVREDAADLAPAQDGSSLVRHLRAAARSYACEVKRRAHSKSPLAFEWADAFRGFVLQATIKRFEKKEEALEALGLGNVVKDRNHHRMIKRELEVVERFLALVEQAPGRRPATQAGVPAKSGLIGGGRPIAFGGPGMRPTGPVLARLGPYGEAGTASQSTCLCALGAGHFRQSRVCIGRRRRCADDCWRRCGSRRGVDVLTSPSPRRIREPVDGSGCAA